MDSKIKSRKIWPPFWKKRSESGKSRFWPFWGKKASQMLFDLNSEPRFESLSSVAAYDHFLLKFSNFDFLIPHCNFKISNGPCGHFFRIRNFRCQIRNQRPKRYKKVSFFSALHVAIAMPKKMVITTRPNDSVRPVAWKDHALNQSIVICLRKGTAWVQGM